MKHPTRIEDLHDAYVRLTGQAVERTMFRESQWAAWLSFRRESPFTVSDLVAVISHLKREIHRGNRKPGSLRFGSLVGNPDWFEEDLELVRSVSRARPVPERVVRVPQVDGSATERRLPGDPAADSARRVGEVLASPAFKEFLNLKENL